MIILAVNIEIAIDEFNKLVFAYGDSVNVTFFNGNILNDVPYYNGYYAKIGQPALIGI